MSPSAQGAYPTSARLVGAAYRLGAQRLAGAPLCPPRPMGPWPWERHSCCTPGGTPWAAAFGVRPSARSPGWPASHRLGTQLAVRPGAARVARGQLAALRRACAPKLLRAQLAPGTAPLNWSSDCIILSRFGLPALFKLRIRHPQGLLCYGAASIAVWLLAAAKPRPRPACSGRRQMASLHSGRLPTHHLPGPRVPACMGSLVAGNAHALDGSST